MQRVASIKQLEPIMHVNLYIIQALDTNVTDQPTQMHLMTRLSGFLYICFFMTRLQF